MKNHKRIFYLLLYLLITVGVTYFTPRTISSVWYVMLLVLYYKSSDEFFWLAFFITVSDGFIGFLSGYSTVITLIPGLPGIDMTQFYILISVFKIRKENKSLTTYYSNWTTLLLVYIFLLIIVGIINGLNGELNVYFRVVKLILPLILIYTIPRLITSINDFKQVLDFLFIVFILGFAAQIFTVFTGFIPANNFRLPENLEELVEDREENLRSFYNPAITLISLFAVLFFLSIKKEKYYSKVYLYFIMGMTFFMAFLSASRGWIICIALIILLFFVFVEKAKNLGRVTLMFLLFILIGMTSKKVRDQTIFAVERFMTLESLAGGDETANGTLARLDERSPVILQAWRENPIFGWGFSNFFLEKSDGHVGNQNILMQAGIVGFSLLMFFILFVNITLLSVFRSFNENSKYKRSALVFIVFFIGYFFLHSSSGQQIAFYGFIQSIITQAIFLGMSSVVYKLCYRKKNSES